jgi:hypothetical protein
MPIAFSALKLGDVVFSGFREKAGHTIRRRTACQKVKILEIDPEGASVLVSSNGNPPRRVRARNGRLT